MQELHILFYKFIMSYGNINPSNTMVSSKIVGVFVLHISSILGDISYFHMRTYNPCGIITYLVTQATTDSLSLFGIASIAID